MQPSSTATVCEFEAATETGQVTQRAQPRIQKARSQLCHVETSLTEERPCEFGVKVSLATTLHRSRGGQFIAHAKALPGNPYDGHTLKTVIPEIETQIGANLTRIVVDRGYRDHNAPPDHKSRSISRARDAASPRPSNANSAAARPSSRSSATPKPGTGWAETISPEPKATPPTPSSPPPATTCMGHCLSSALHKVPSSHFVRRDRGQR